MAASPTVRNKSEVARNLALIWGDDEFSVKKRARQVFNTWCQESGSVDQEIVDASAGNGNEALKAISRLREALDTLPFFGGAKVVWFQNCNFLGEDRVAGGQAVTEALSSFAEEIKAFPWRNVRLLISSGKVDKRRTFYKTIEKQAQVENFSELSIDDKEWIHKAEAWIEAELKGKTISGEALAEFVSSVGPNLRQLGNELEKLSLYCGSRPNIELSDVKAITTRQKQAKAFELAEALGDRDLPRLLRALDESFWELKFDSSKSPIGLLYGLISKVRVLLALKECQRAGFLKAESDYNRFKAQLERMPADLFPEDKRLNPLSGHPYVIFRALPQTRRYSIAELIHAMESLLKCNRQLIFSNLDEALVMQQTLVQIVGGGIAGGAC